MAFFVDKSLAWQDRLRLIVDMMREMSLQTDPEAMVRAYGRRFSEILPYERFVALSRRGLEPPHVRVTRASVWSEQINPWKETERLPVYDRGLLSELIYDETPRIIHHLEVPADDPAYAYLAGMRSLQAVPHFDNGRALNMVISASSQPEHFPFDTLPEMVWLSSLFGRATQSLVLSDQLQAAYAAVDRELQLVADIQRSLLPRELPRISTLDLAAHYQTSRRAGGDYYDFFPLPDGQWGIFLADVSGHGTPAAVMMAITHTVAHEYPGPPTPPSAMLRFVNDRLAGRYLGDSDAFVTAFYGIYDPSARTLRYSSAGHPPPRLRRDHRSIEPLDGTAGLPLGIAVEQDYPEHQHSLAPGDLLVFYTDGVTEGQNAAGELFGLSRLDQAMAACAPSAQTAVESILTALDQFAAGHAADDDRTLVAAKVR